MPLSLTNYTKTLTAPLLKKAKSCAVRECDEAAKGRYEGYVDEGADTYDVALTIATNKEVAEHRCDCGLSIPFCQHKAALLLTIAEGKKATNALAGKKAKSKQSKTDALLDDVDVAELKEWVRTLLVRNSDLALAFTQRFGSRKTVYTKAEAEAITADAAKSVVKNRSRVEQSELKKIVDLWTDVHEPIVKAYTDNVTSEEAFAAFHSAADACLAFAEKVAATGIKITAYVDALLKRTVEAIAVLHDDVAFTTATAFYISHLLNGRRGVRLHYLQHLQNILAVSNKARATTVLAKLVQQYSKAQPDNLVRGDAYTKNLFALADAQGLLNLHLQVFKPITFDNAFNVLLIEKLVAAGELLLAEKHSKQQIAANYREEYNLPYLRLLRKIYAAQKNEEGVAEVAEKLLPFTFDFDDYLFLYNRMEESDAKRKWRTKIITKSRNASGLDNNSASNFYFRLLHHEESYKKMIDSINAHTPYEVILTYTNPMALTDKQRFLEALLNKSDDSIWGLSPEQRQTEASVFPELQAALLKHFSPKLLLTAIKQAQTTGFYFRGNRLVKYLKEHLIAE